MRKEAERNTSETESKHAHLMTVVGMCKRLLFVLSSVFRPYKTLLRAFSLQCNLEEIEEEVPSKGTKRTAPGYKR
jgi:hypothetical protein